MKLIRLFVLPCILSLFNLSYGKSQQFVPSIETGTQWDVEVSLYPPDWMATHPKTEPKKQLDSLKAQYVYDVVVRVIGLDSSEGVATWKIEFVPSSNAPKGVRGHTCIIWIAVHDYAIVKFMQFGDVETGNPIIKTQGNITYIEDAPYGFPIDIFYFNIPDKTGEKGRRGVMVGNKHFNANEKILNGENTKDFEIMQNGTQKMKIRQIWKDINPCWISYEKEKYGYKDISAKIKTK